MVSNIFLYENWKQKSEHCVGYEGCTLLVQIGEHAPDTKIPYIEIDYNSSLITLMWLGDNNPNGIPTFRKFETFKFETVIGN
jgi:hypothetical protein